MRDLYALEAFTDDGMTIRTAPHTIAEAMAIVDEHTLTAPSRWRHRYLPLTPLDQALKHFNVRQDPPRPVLEADFFVALRRAIIADPEHDGLESEFVLGMLAHVDPHRPMQMYLGDEECMLGECGHPDRDDNDACEGMERADVVCTCCTAIIDSNTEFGPYYGPHVVWPCPVVTTAAEKYGITVGAAA